MQPYISYYPLNATFVWKHFPDKATMQYFIERVNPQLVIEESVERLLIESPVLENKECEPQHARAEINPGRYPKVPKRGWRLYR